MGCTHFAYTLIFLCEMTGVTSAAGMGSRDLGMPLNGGLLLPVGPKQWLRCGTKEMLGVWDQSDGGGMRDDWRYGGVLLLAPGCAVINRNAFWGDGLHG